MRRAVLAFLLLLPLHAARSEPLWQTLPPTPAPVPGEHTGHAKVNGISSYYATIGHGSPVVLLHGGLSNSAYWGNQIRALVGATALFSASTSPFAIQTTSRCLDAGVAKRRLLHRLDMGQSSQSGHVVLHDAPLRGRAWGHVRRSRSCC